MAEYLTDKRVILSNPGTSRNDLYYTNLNTTVEQVEATYNLGRFKQSLSNVQFGGQALVVVPNSSFLGKMYLHLTLPATVANQTICRGWGYGCIDSVSYLFGSSNVPQIQIDGQSVLQTVMTQCETEEKRSELFNLGGEVILTSGRIPEANILIPLPWSTACGMGPNNKKPFDTNLLDAPITISIKFRNSDAIYGGIGARPVTFTAAQAIFRQGNLSNKALSLKNSLAAQPDMMLAYPFIHHQSARPPRFSASLPTEEVSVVLQSFINADLLAITVGVVDVYDLQSTSNNSPSPNNYQELSDVQLLFNGEQMFDAPGAIYKLATCQSIPGAGYFKNDVIRPGTTGTFASDGVDTYILIVDFSRIRSICYEGEYQNVRRMGNQVLELRFKLPNNGSAATNYQMFATYHYSGVATIQNGMSNIYFD